MRLSYVAHEGDLMQNGKKGKLFFMKTRNYGIDCYRVLMLFWVIIYHLWVINGRTPIHNICVQSLITLGGEIGVTGFFVLSGWSIFYAVERMDGYWEYIKRRLF